MANTTIQIKRSGTNSATPSVLDYGELAINYADGKLFYKAANGSIYQLNTGASGGNYFGTVNANSTLLVADTTGDVLGITPGNNITIVGDAINDTLTIGLKDNIVIPPAGSFLASAAGGDEGGEIHLANAVTNSVLNDYIVIDVYQNKLRFFESGAPNRGAFINLASASTGVGTDLLAAASATDAVARNIANGAFDKANAANLLAYDTGISANNYAGAMANASNTLASAAFDKANNSVQYTTAGTYTAGARQAFTPNANFAGLSVGTLAGNPANLSDGDIWTNSSTSRIYYRLNAGNRELAQLDAQQTFAARKTFTSTNTQVGIIAITPVASLPTSTVNGDIIISRTDNLVYYYANSSWKYLPTNTQLELLATSANNYAGVMANSSNALASAAFDKANNSVQYTAAGTYSAGAKQTFGPNATFSGISIPPAGTGNPTTQASGDVWLTTGGSLRYNVGGVTWVVGTLNITNSWGAGAKQTFLHNASAAGLRISDAAGNPSTIANGDIWLVTNDARFSTKLANNNLYLATNTDIDIANSYAGVMANSANAFAGNMVNSANALIFTTANSLTNSIYTFSSTTSNVTVSNTTPRVIQLSPGAAVQNLKVTFDTVCNVGKIVTIINNTADPTYNCHIVAGGTQIIDSPYSWQSIIGAGDPPITLPFNSMLTFVCTENNVWRPIAFVTKSDPRPTLVSNTANAAFDKANSANVLAYDTGIGANAWANTKVSSSGGTITGDLSIVGNLYITGNSQFQNVTTLSIGDPLIYLAANNYATDVVDIGFIANYVNATGSNVHTGFYREHVDKMYYLFNGYDQEPINNHIGALSNNMTLAVLNADLKTSNLNLGGANAITWISSAYVNANAAYDKANSANVLAFNTGVGANAYASAVGTSANAYAAVVGTSANAYSNTLLVTARAYTNTSTSSANNYAGVLANGVATNAASAFGFANGVATNTTAAFAFANGVSTNTTAAFATANAAYTIANAAFTKANTATSGGGGAYTGNNGEASGTGLGDIFRVHSNTITQNVTIYSGNNAVAVGPLVLQTGKKITIQTGARMSIV